MWPLRWPLRDSQTPRGWGELSVVISSPDRSYENRFNFLRVAVRMCFLCCRRVTGKAEKSTDTITTSYFSDAQWAPTSCDTSRHQIDTHTWPVIKRGTASASMLKLRHVSSQQVRWQAGFTGGAESLWGWCVPLLRSDVLFSPMSFFTSNTNITGFETKSIFKTGGSIKLPTDPGPVFPENTHLSCLSSLTFLDC